MHFLSTIIDHSVQAARGSQQPNKPINTLTEISPTINSAIENQSTRTPANPLSHEASVETSVNIFEQNLIPVDSDSADFQQHQNMAKNPKQITEEPSPIDSNHTDIEQNKAKQTVLTTANPINRDTLEATTEEQVDTFEHDHIPVDSDSIDFQQHQNVAENAKQMIEEPSPVDSNHTDIEQDNTEVLTSTNPISHGTLKATINQQANTLEQNHIPIDDDITDLQQHQTTTKNPKQIIDKPSTVDSNSTYNNSHKTTNKIPTNKKTNVIAKNQPDKLLANTKTEKNKLQLHNQHQPIQKKQPKKEKQQAQSTNQTNTLKNNNNQKKTTAKATQNFNGSEHKAKAHPQVTKYKPAPKETPQVRIGQINVLIKDQAAVKPKYPATRVNTASSPFGIRGL